MPGNLASISELAFATTLWDTELSEKRVQYLRSTLRASVSSSEKLEAGKRGLRPMIVCCRS